MNPATKNENNLITNFSKPINVQSKYIHQKLE